MNVTSNEIKPRTVYLLKRTDRPDNGKDLYVGSTSQPLKKRLYDHKSETQRKGNVNKSKLHTRMLEVGIHNWEIIPLLTFSCIQKTIREFEREWCDLLNADLNSNSPFSNLNSKSKEYFANYCKLNGEKIYQRIAKCHKSNIQHKVYHCSVCEKSFVSNSLLKRHLDTLKHQYAYINSLD